MISRRIVSVLIVVVRSLMAQWPDALGFVGILIKPAPLAVEIETLLPTQLSAP